MNDVSSTGTLDQDSYVTHDELDAIVHELRTPLHSIRGLARLLLEGKAKDVGIQREFLSLIAQ